MTIASRVYLFNLELIALYLQLCEIDLSDLDLSFLRSRTMKRFKKPKEIICLLITILCMDYFYPQYFESEFPLFIDLFTTPIFSLFVVLNIFTTTITLKFVRNNAIRIALVFLYSIAIALLFREVINGNDNILQIKSLFVILQISVLVMGLTSKGIKFRGEY